MTDTNTTSVAISRQARRAQAALVGSVAPAEDSGAAELRLR